MNQLIQKLAQDHHKGVQDEKQPDYIIVNVVVNLEKANLNLQTSIDPKIPFYIFIRGINEQIFAQGMQAQYEETMEYQLNNGSSLSQSDNRTLRNLGFTNNCTLNVRLKLRGYNEIAHKRFNKRLYKVLVKLKNNTIQLFVEQLKTSPVSCVFHDILVELFQNYQVDISLPFVFFINDTEVQPFDVRLIQDFQTNAGIIIITLVVPKKKPNQDSIEKYKFALNKSKQIKLCQRKIITIELINRMQFFTYTDISLKEIFEKIKVDLQLQHRFGEYQINNKVSIGLQNIYAINDFKFTIENQNGIDLNCFKLIGDFNKKIKIKGLIDENQYVIEETIPMNTPMIEFLKDFQFKLFGPKQNNYTQEILEQRDDLVVLNYSMIKK